MLDKIAQQHWVSATQLDTYRLCPRKWGWYKLDGIVIEGPPNAYAERGLKLHKVAENWLRDGTPVDTDTDEGKIFVPGIKFLPPPGEAKTEQKFHFQTEVAVYTGLWDAILPFKEGVLRAIDHKTTADFKWVKTPQDLRIDIQANLYSVAALCLIRDQGVDLDKTVLQLDWVYYRSNPKKPGSRLSRLYIVPGDVMEGPEGVAMTQGELAERFEEIEAVSAILLDHHRQGHRARDLEYSIEGCNAFGGCPFRGNPCVLTTSEIMRGHMAQQSLADRIAARKKEQAGTASGGDSGGGSDLGARIRAAKAKPAEQDASPEVVERAQAAKEAVATGQEESSKVNPPGEAAPASKVITKQAFEAEARKIVRGELNIVRIQGAATIASGLVQCAGVPHDEAPTRALQMVDEIISKACA